MNCSWKLCHLDNPHENRSGFTTGLILKNCLHHLGCPLWNPQEKFVLQHQSSDICGSFEQLVCFSFIDIGHLVTSFTVTTRDLKVKLETDRVYILCIAHSAGFFLFFPSFLSPHTHSRLHFSFNQLHCMYLCSLLWSFFGDKVDVWINNGQWFLF